ncbi:hypothetical protein J2S66_002907 [Saccharothrix longispora]|uniref:Uncharacterized protein n=1 Tax=Saccharothrix longispora TaxID=33920 RepID=A0ABU1PW58_9PSEU|nr:hypothetical protein [Saccharothrix longispora]
MGYLALNTAEVDDAEVDEEISEAVRDEDEDGAGARSDD